MARFAGPLLSILRIVTALLFIEHGAMKLFGFPPGPMPQPPLVSVLGLAAILEVFGGLLVLVGLFTRPVAFVLAGEMAVAYWTSHAPQGPFPALNMGEGAILFCFIFLFIAAAGPGPWAVQGESLPPRREGVR
jgi:putative oxidoreductase